jgi:hypothetical protein
MKMRIRSGHVVAFVLGLSGNAWIDLLHEMPAKLRLALELILAVLPLVTLGILLTQPYAVTAGRLVADGLVVALLWLVVLFWFARLLVRTKLRRRVSLGESLAFILVLLAMGSASGHSAGSTA